MKKIFWRVLIYFGVVLIVFTVFIGLIFTKFNRSNIVGAYKDQLGDLAASVAQRTSEAVKDKEIDTYQNYLGAIEDFCDMQDVDVWVVSNPSGKPAMNEDYTNVDIGSVTVPEETNRILRSAYNGKKKNYSNFDNIYQRTMLHLAVPIRDSQGDVIGAVLVTGPMEMQENTIVQYEKYMLICIVVGLLMATILALYFSRQMVSPIIKIKESALILAAGKYEHKTGIKRKDELGSLAESMDILSDKLVAAEKFREGQEQNRRDFFSNISHELRTPIAVMKGYADTLADGYVSEREKQSEYIERIRSECTGMERLVSDLLILSRMQNPEYKMDMEVLNLIAVAQDAMRGIRILMSEKNLTGDVIYEDACSLIEGDYDRIRQLFTILLQNAVKYSDEGTKITVHVVRSGGKIIASVTDFGSVIPSEEWDDIFEKFYRASNHGEKDGSGLGLVVAKNIVERHGGTIFVTSSKEDGTCFTVEFPETSENIA
ncbi:MAG: HAMP domain-containing histidine kinase [Lachnospiraceae bacterium]|nr:HAMP domain-containing histidine kinase [Lachnospiraceae bacterium]